MSFPSMNHGHPKRSGHLEDLSNCRNNGPDCRVDFIIATLDGAKSILVDKVPLHIDD
jgi:hypothetical protein